MAAVILSVPSVAQQRLDPDKVCGPPDETLTENIKGDLKGTAQTLAKLGTAELQGKVEIQRNRIIVGKNRGDALRELHYLNSVSCALILADASLTTDDKLTRVGVLRKGLTLSNQRPSK